MLLTKPLCCSEEERRLARAAASAAKAKLKSKGGKGRGGGGGGHALGGGARGEDEGVSSGLVAVLLEVLSLLVLLVQKYIN